MLPESGPIGLSDVALELGHGGKDIGMHIIMSSGDKYVNVNGQWVKICKCSMNQPLYPAPFSIFDWYGYDHSAQGVTGVDIVGKTAVLPGEIVAYEALINGPNQIGITLLWETYNGSSWSVAGYGTTINITWSSNPAIQKLRLTVQGQCQGGESVKQLNITQKVTYYNLISCNTSNNVIRQTITPISTEGQNVFWGEESIHFWDGTVSDVATDYIGEVYMGVDTYCGGSAPTIYRILERCSNGQRYCTTAKIGRKYQRVKDASNNVYWYIGEISRTAIYSVVSVDLVHGKNRCVDPIGDPVYYNLTKCGGGPPAQTPTPIPAGNMRVFAGVHGVYVSTGTSSTNPPTNDVGEVNISGAYGCDDGGSSGGGIYNELYRCSNGALYYTTKSLTVNGQKVSTPFGEMYWTGSTTNSPGTVISEVDVTILNNQTGCAGSGGTTYYQLRRCGTQDMYYTPNNPGTPGQRVASLSVGTLVYTGGTSSSPPNNIGGIVVLNGQWGCEGEGSGTEYKSDYRKDHIRKSNCTSGEGTLVEVTATLGQFTSMNNAQEANDMRDAWMQAQANEHGSCTSGGCIAPHAPSLFNLVTYGPSTEYINGNPYYFKVFSFEMYDNSFNYPGDSIPWYLNHEVVILSSTGDYAFLAPTLIKLYQGASMQVHLRYYYDKFSSPCLGPPSGTVNLVY